METRIATTDISTECREAASMYGSAAFFHLCHDAILTEAADEIDRLRAALRRMMKHAPPAEEDCGAVGCEGCGFWRPGRAALGEPSQS